MIYLSTFYTTFSNLIIVRISFGKLVFGRKYYLLESERLKNAQV